MSGREVDLAALFIIEGVLAAEDGEGPAGNPHEPGSQEHLLWFAGYDAALRGAASVASRVSAFT